MTTDVLRPRRSWACVRCQLILQVGEWDIYEHTGGGDAGYYATSVLSTSSEMFAPTLDTLGNRLGIALESGDGLDDEVVDDEA